MADEAVDEQYSCSSCSRPDSAADMIVCEKCDKSFHFDCVKPNIDWDIEKRIEDFICTSCEDETGALTSWRGRTPTGRALTHKNKHYYEVEKIINHKIHGNGTRSFHVKWKNYRSSNWLPEVHLDGCLDTLQKYCKTNGLLYSALEAKLGSTTRTLEEDESNFVTISKVIDVVSVFRTMKAYQTNLDIGRLPEFDNGDKIFIFGVERHCYVLLYLAPNRGYIADGLNSYLDMPSRRPEVDQVIQAPDSLNIKAIRFDQQIKSDHCGSSGALITLELMRAYKKDQLDSIEKLIAPKHLRDRVRSKLHPHPSETVVQPSLTERREQWACDLCERTFRTRKSLWGHQVAHVRTSRQ